MQNEYVSEECEITCEDNGNVVTGEMLSFNRGKSLSVAIKRSVKLTMHWNGKKYIGNMGNLTFITDGPVIRTVNNKLR